MKKVFLKVEDVNKPLKKGEEYLVPCLVNRRHFLAETVITYISPVINHPHSDKENGQKEVHYHIDYRFVKHLNDSTFPTVMNNHSRYYFVENIRPTNFLNILEYFILPVINEEFAGITPVENIAKSKLKRKCIHNEKCPHRGYPLSQVKPVNGKITCPLHGLKFDAATKKIIS